MVRTIELKAKENDSKLRKITLLAGAVAAFLFALVSLVFAFISFTLIGDISSLLNITQTVTTNILIPTVIGVGGLILSKILLNKALSLKEWEHATPVLIGEAKDLLKNHLIEVVITLVVAALLIVHWMTRR